MANLKNITELPIVESAEGLNLIVNDNGHAKQIPASKMGGVQPDWNQNDETAPDYVKNRPFYIETKEVTTVLKPMNSTLLEGFPVFNVGDKVTVKVDNVEYTLTAFDNVGYPSIGDSLLDLTNGTVQYGWFIMNNGPLAKGASVIADVTITYVAEDVHEIISKYLFKEPWEALGIKLNYLISQVENWFGDSQPPTELQMSIDEFYEIKRIVTRCADGNLLAFINNIPVNCSVTPNSIMLRFVNMSSQGVNHFMYEFIHDLETNVIVLGITSTYTHWA